jgi:hypothetical protein
VPGKPLTPLLQLIQRKHQKARQKPGFLRARVQTEVQT